MLHLICPTLQMSHDGDWRDTCVSTGRDSPWRWLWRLVRLGCLGSMVHGVGVFFRWLRSVAYRYRIPAATSF
jgi:hypothetical protein